MTYAPAAPVSRSALRRRLADPLSRNGLALLANTGITGALGFAYWIAAARLFPAAAVGRAGALISAVGLFAAVGQLNLSGALMRFLPVAGGRGRSLVLRVYGFAAGVSALLATVVLVASAPLRVSAGVAAGLVFASAGTAVFALQDSVLVGLRRGVWVPVENAAFGLAKIVLLAVLAGQATALALVVSWMAPMLAIVPVVTVLLFGRLLPRRTAAPGPGVPDGRALGRFVAGDAAAGLFSQAWLYLLPVLVAGLLGTVANAHFYVALLLASTVDLVSANLTNAMTVEAAHHPERLAALTRTTLLRAFALVLALVAAAWVLAPWILHWYGAGYPSAVPVLRLLLLSCLPRCLFLGYEAVCRARRQTGRAAALSGVDAAGAIAGAAAATSLTGVGVAVLGAHALTGLIAGAALVPLLRGHR